MGNLQRGGIGLFAVLGIFAAAAGAAAQDGPGLGIGPRVTFQTGDDSIPNQPSLRLLGGQVRLRLTPKTIIELSADYKSSTNEALTEKVKSLPVQASLLLFPVRATISPYVLGGLGWYSQSVTTVARAGDTQSIREIGYHGGLGAELRAGKHIALHADYRYTHIRFGGDDSRSAASVATVTTALSLIPKLTALQESLKLSHQGSVWNWGMTFFF